MRRRKNTADCWRRLQWKTARDENWKNFSLSSFFSWRAIDAAYDHPAVRERDGPVAARIGMDHPPAPPGRRQETEVRVVFSTRADQAWCTPNPNPRVGVIHFPPFPHPFHLFPAAFPHLASDQPTVSVTFHRRSAAFARNGSTRRRSRGLESLLGVRVVKNPWPNRVRVVNPPATS